MTGSKLFSLLVAGVIAGGAVANAPAYGQSPEEITVREVWTVALPKPLRSRIYQAAVIASDGDGPVVVVGTTPQDVLAFDGEIRLLLDLKRGGATGETAILPATPAAGSLEALTLGIMEHEHHDVGRFRLVSGTGEPVSVLDDPRHFHYRVAPDGRSFIGLDALGKHAALTAERVIYRLFDRQGGEIAEFESLEPGSPDSAYTPDGGGFLVNSGETGLSLYSTRDGKRLWTAPGRFRLFAPARASVQYVLAVDERQRDQVGLYQAGKRVGQMALGDGNGNGNVRNIAIAPGGGLAAVSDATRVVVFQPGLESRPTEFRVDDRLTINSLAVSDRGLIAVGAQQAGISGTEPATGRVIVLDAQAQPLLQLDTDHRRSNAWIPTVEFDARGRFLLVRTLEMVKLLALD